MTTAPNAPSPTPTPRRSGNSTAWKFPSRSGSLRVPAGNFSRWCSWWYGLDMSIWIYTFCTSFIGAMVALLLSFWRFDRLLRMEYGRYRSQWELDGCPIGFFWVPPGAFTWSGCMARASVSLAWTWHRPAWVMADAEAALGYAAFKRVSNISYWFLGAFFLHFVAALVWLLSALGP